MSSCVAVFAWSLLALVAAIDDETRRHDTKPPVFRVNRATHQDDQKLSSGYQLDDLEWTKWVRVSWWAGNSQPAWLDRDAARQYALDTLQPDIVDWYQGLDMNRGQFFRKRGVAVSTGSSWEYDQDFAMQTDGPGFSREHFMGNGIEQNEDGSPVFQEHWHAYAMEHFAPRWQQVELQGLARRAVMGDSVAQDNLGAQYAFAPHWSDWTCRRFVHSLRQRNISSLGGVPIDQLNETSGVRQHLSRLRAAGNTNDQIGSDPVIREYMRFYMRGLTDHWTEITSAAKDVARMANVSQPAAYGNLGGGVITNYSRPCGLVLHQSVDVIWNEDTGSLAGQRNYSASLSLKISEAAGTKPDGSKTPNWIDRFSGANLTVDCTFNAVAAAEATANDGVLAGDISAIIPGDACWSAWSAHARLVQKQTWLFTDRIRASEAVIVYSLPTVVWRHFSTVSELFDGGSWDDFQAQHTSVGRHFIWLTYASKLLDESHISFRGQVLGHPDLMQDSPALDTLTSKTKLVVLPGIDAVSDLHAALLASWVRNGGHLVLWGEDSGALNEELIPRQANTTAWTELLRGPTGRGTITVVNRTVIDVAVGGVADSTAERHLVQLFRKSVDTQLLKTTAPRDVYTTLWQHGGGDSAVSVDLVHYSTHKSDFTSPFILEVQAPARCTSLMFYSVEYPDGVVLVLSRASNGSVRVSVPSFHVFGIVVLVAPGERCFRDAAARLRRSVNRISIAGRSHGADASLASHAVLRGAEVLKTVQGVPHNSFPTAAISDLADEFNQTLVQLMKSVDASQAAANTSLRATGSTAVRAFKFGLGRCGVCRTELSCDPGNIPFGFVPVVYNDPPWNSSNSAQTHGFLCENNTGCSDVGHAITTEGDKPGNFPAVPGANSTTWYDCFYFDYFLSSTPMTFRITNLTNGQYIVTIVTGSYNNYEEVAHTAVSSPSDPGAGMLGDRTHSGIWEHRAFRVQVRQNGTLDLIVGSRNYGSLFQSAYNGWGGGMVSFAVQALTLHRASDVHLLTPFARASLAKNDAISAAALRRWYVVGPFSDVNATGLERRFAAEAATFDPIQTFASGWSAPDMLDGAPATIKWRPASLPPNGSAVALELPFKLPAAISNRSVAVAATTFRVSTGGTAILSVSSAQQAVVLLNGVQISKKQLAAGALPVDGEYTVELKGGVNTLMLRLCLHYGAFSTNGIEYESATDWWAGLWQSSPSGRRSPLTFEGMA